MTLERTPTARQIVRILHGVTLRQIEKWSKRQGHFISKRKIYEYEAGIRRPRSGLTPAEIQLYSDAIASLAQQRNAS
jgi:hypothetical protein